MQTFLYRSQLDDFFSAFIESAGGRGRGGGVRAGASFSDCIDDGGIICLTGANSNRRSYAIF